MTEAVINNFIEDAVSGSTEQNKSYIESFLSQVSEFRENEFTCDVVIKISGKEIHAHKLVLAAGSPYFSMCFFGVLAGRQRIDVNEVKLDDLEFSAVDAIIQYCYSSKINITENTVKELFKAADFLQVEWVREKCAAYIKKILTISNCIDFWHFSESLCADLLSSDLVLFILQNLTEISTKPEFLALSDEKMRQLNSHKSNKVSAKALYLGTIKWTKQDVENRRSTFNALMKDFPLKSLDKGFIKSYLANEDLILSDHSCLKLFCDAILHFISPTNEVDRSSDNKATNFIKKTNSTPYIFTLTAACKKSFIQFYNPYDECLKYIPPHDVIFPFAAIVAYKDFICISGGLQNVERQKNCLMFNTMSDQWTTTKIMNWGKAYHDMIVCNDVLYACNIDFGLERYDGDRNIWNIVSNSPCFPISSSAEKTNCISADVLDGRIFAVSYPSPESQSNKSNLQSFDPREGYWRAEINQSGYCSILNFHNSLYLSSTSLSYLEKYDVRNKRTIPSSSPQSHPPVFGHTMTRFGDSIYLFDANAKNVTEFNQPQNEWIRSKPLNGSFNYVRAAVPKMFDI